MTNQDRSEAPLAQLIVGGWSTECSACGGNASPCDDFHDRGGPKSMWHEGSSLANRNGCGARFTNTDDPLVRRLRRH